LRIADFEFAAAHWKTIFHLPVYFVYLIVMVEEAFKFIMSIWRYRSKRWIHDLISA
jgi:Na+-driven multidrug efflux pump